MFVEIDNFINKNGYSRFLTKKYFNYLLLAGLFFFCLYLNWSLMTIFIFIGACWLLFFPIEILKLTLIAIALLGASGIATVLNSGKFAEIFSVVSFMLFSLVVIKLLARKWSSK